MSVSFSDAMLPPHDPDSERSVLGSLMLMPAAIDEIASMLTWEQFYVRAHQVIYKAITGLHSRNVPAIDIVTIANELQRLGEFDECGGALYLAEILQTVPHASHARYYAKTVIEMATRREMIIAARDMLKHAYDRTTDIGDVGGVMVSKIENLFGTSVDDVRTFAEVAANLRIRQLQPTPAHSTGFGVLDAKLKSMIQPVGGFFPSQLIFVAARPAMGKTAFGWKLIEASAEAGTPALMIPLEMEAEDLANRVQLQGDKRVDEVAQLPIYFEDRHYDLDAVINTIRLAYRRKAVRFVVIDYLGLIEVDDRGKSEEKIAKITRRLKLLAKDLRIPIVVLAQLNRDLEKRDNKRPILSDLRGSGAIEQDADVVMFLYRHEVYHPDEKKGVCEVIIAKQRNGPVCTVEVGYIAQKTMFVDRSMIETEVDIDGLFAEKPF